MSSEIINLNDSSPAAGSGYMTGKFQKGPTSGTDPTYGVPIYPVSEEVPANGSVSKLTGSATAAAGDCGKLLSFTLTATATYTLPATPPSVPDGGGTNRWKVGLKNQSASTAALTLAATSPAKLDGTTGGSVTLSAGSGIDIFTDGTDYFTEGGGGSGNATSLQGIPIDSSAATPSDGGVLLYEASAGKYFSVVDRPAWIVSFVPGLPAAGQIVSKFVAPSTTTFPGNFSTPNAYGNCGTNPTATATYTIYKNGVSTGTISISTSGVFTFATTSGASVSLNAGDVITVVAPGTADATLADVSFILVGTRAPAAAISTPIQFFTWRNTYSGSTTYNVNDVVYFHGTAYVCISPSTGNLPSNATYWNVMAGGMQWQGTYAAGTQYYPNDVVSYSNSTYICIAASLGNLPTNATYWSLIALAGTLQPADQQNQTYDYVVGGGSANAYTASPSTAYTGPTDGQQITVKIPSSQTNTGASTLNVSGLGAVAIKKAGTSGLTALVAGDLQAGCQYIFTYNSSGPCWELMGGGAAPAPALMLVASVNVGSATSFTITGLNTLAYDYRIKIRMQRTSFSASSDNLQIQFGDTGGTTTWFTTTCFITPLGANTGGLSTSGGITKIAQVQNNTTANMGTDLDLQFTDDGLCMNGLAHSYFWENIVQFDGGPTPSQIGAMKFTTVNQAWNIKYSLYAIQR